MMYRTKTRVAILVAAWMVVAIGCAADGLDEPGTTEMSATAGVGAPSPSGGGDTPVPTNGGTSGGTMAPTVVDTPIPTGSDASTSIEGGIDPVGVWWTEIETKGSETLPWLGTLSDTDIRFVMRVEVSGQAPSHLVTFDFCELQTEWIHPDDPNNITTIGFRPNTVAAFSESIDADLGGLQRGSRVPLPSLAFLGGLDETGMDFDDDGDGNPAVTAWVQTLLGIQIEVYETITISASLDLVVADEDTLSGTLDFRADALILSSNNPIIFAGTVVTIIPDSTEVPITVKRLPAGATCSDLPSTVTFTPVPPPPPALFPPPTVPAPTP